MTRQGFYYEKSESGYVIRRSSGPLKYLLLDDGPYATKEALEDGVRRLSGYILGEWTPAVERACMAILEAEKVERDMALLRERERQEARRKDVVVIRSRKSIPGVSLGDIEMSVRAERCLQSYGFETVADVMDVEDAELLRIPHLGRRTLREIRRFAPCGTPPVVFRAMPSPQELVAAWPR